MISKIKSENKEGKQQVFRLQELNTIQIGSSYE